MPHTVVYGIEPDAPAGTPESGVMLHEYAVGKYGDTFNDSTGRGGPPGGYYAGDPPAWASGARADLE